MNGTDGSNFRAVALGLVASNKPRGTSIINVVPIEMTSDINADIKSNNEDVVSSGKSSDGTPFKVSINRGADIEAEWLGDTNRLTSPDVRRMEQVILWKTGDSKKYYWSSMGRDDKLRRLETVVWGFSGDPSNNDDEKSRDNSYIYEINTHDGMVVLSTSGKNGEKAKYIFQFNCRDGQVTLEDDLGNHIFLDSVEKQIELRNGDDSFLNIIKKAITMSSDDSIDFKSKTITTTCEELITTASSTYTTTTPLASFSDTVACQLLVAGGFVGGGPSGPSGTPASMGAGAVIPDGKGMEVTGAVTGEDFTTAGGITLGTHKHNNGGAGQPIP